MKTCPQCGKEYDAQTKFCPTDGSTLRSASGSGDDIIGSVIADRYHVIRKLGEGGMGQVYLAEHVKMGRMSAIKVMTPALVHDTDAVGRFNREAANASRINHPNIAAIYDFGETSDGLIYLAMEFVEGESLTKLCEALGALPAPRAAEITRQVASALEAAHERGIVHRDLKPDNIMISRGRDGADLVKVVDFGIAKAAEGAGQKVTRTGLVVGTPEYMSPEQLTGDTLDGRSDLYALALVTFNMLTGMLPFTGQTTQEALLKRLTDRPLSLAEARPDLFWSPELQAVLDRALSRLAQDRYQHANEFGAAMVAAVAGMRDGELLHAPTLVIPGTATGAGSAVPTTAASTAASASASVPSTASSPPTASAPPAVAALPPAPRTARDRFLVPALLVAALIVIVGGAMFKRARAARAVNVASTPTVDSAASGLGEPSTAPLSAPSTPPSSSTVPPTASDSDDDKRDSSDSNGSGADSVVSTSPTATPVPGAGAGPRLGTRIRERRAEKDASRKSKAPVIPTAPSSSLSAPPVAPATPPVQPPVTTSSAPANAEQARAAVAAAGTMVDDDKPAE
ncbi:MAG: serine/threonine protein kinase, partial [Gemmatimonadota bacterium]|nr:serine/threonine protein kinase [Gemmatimonadota bacterium]